MSGAVTSGPLDWARDGPAWPNSSASRRVDAGGLLWHVQIMGQGPIVLLLHGTGASTHSWRTLAPQLAAHFTLVMPDLPGHAFTSAPPAAGLTLPAMAAAIGALVRELKLGAGPAVVVGHSAGAAIGLAMVRDRLIEPRGIIGLNAALLPFAGLAGLVFQPMARLLTLNPLMANLVASQGKSRSRVADTLAGTGSTLDAAGIDLYQRLFSDPRHVQTALQMMAGWDLAPLVRAFPTLSIPLALIVAGGDRAVPPEQGGLVADQMKSARVLYLRNYGHLAHEEAPDEVARMILDAATPWLATRP